LVMLALDGAYRSGHSPKEICEALVQKYKINLTRKWGPDEHVRGEPDA